MTRGTLLSLVNVSLLAGLVLASSDVVAQQQQAPNPGNEIVYTICGPGVLEMCGQKDLFHCEWRFDVRFSTLPFGGGLQFGSQHCVKSGQIPLYKNRVGAVSYCSSVGIPNGPPGEDDGANYLEQEGFSDLCTT